MNTGVTYGIYVAAASIALSLIFNLTGADFEGAFGSIVYYATSLIIPAAGIFLAVKERKVSELEGVISFGKSFSTGMTVVVISALIFAVYNYVYLSFIDPEMVDKIIEMSERRIRENPDMSDADKTTQINMMSPWMTPPLMALWGFAGSLFFGALISLVIAAILRTRGVKTQEVVA
jgi:hypothetical protein